ncbi:hypothetical protein U9M48_020780 [Paspalum notatum var. saurae]|uniref:DUF674 domain-containing protein n=1 Tax=Paspalum notatum var. saurae TaxID=547442 RepID=A0AAQ3WST3_PASNO
MATSTTTLKMKLLIDDKAKRVLFAEAGKDVVDFLFSLLALPVATIVKMLGKGSMFGSFGNLYSSVEKLDYDYVIPGVEKNAVLRPKVVPSAASTSRSSLLLLAPSSGQAKSFFKCGSNYYTACRDYVTDTSGTVCPNCYGKMNVALKFVQPATASSGKDVQKPSAGAAKGFVQGVVTYTVRDNLTVTPMSAISSIALLSTLKVTDYGALKEKTVRLGYTEALEILRASLQSTTVLTDVFLGNKRPQAPRGTGTSQRVCAEGGDVQGEPVRDDLTVTAHVHHLQYHRAQGPRGDGLRRAPGEDGAAWLHRGDTSIRCTLLSMVFAEMSSFCIAFEYVMCHTYTWNTDFAALQGVEILRASLQSMTVLTDVFLINKRPLGLRRGVRLPGPSAAAHTRHRLRLDSSGSGVWVSVCSPYGRKASCFLPPRFLPFRFAVSFMVPARPQTGSRGGNSLVLIHKAQLLWCSNCVAEESE